MMSLIVGRLLKRFFATCSAHGSSLTLSALRAPSIKESDLPSFSLQALVSGEEIAPPPSADTNFGGVQRILEDPRRDDHWGNVISFHSAHSDKADDVKADSIVQTRIVDTDFGGVQRILEDPRRDDHRGNVISFHSAHSDKADNVKADSVM